MHHPSHPTEEMTIILGPHHISHAVIEIESLVHAAILEIRLEIHVRWQLRTHSRGHRGALLDVSPDDRGVQVLSAPLNQQVPWLDTPVHQPLAVRGIEGPRGLTEQEQGGSRRNHPAPILDHLPHVGPRAIPHGDLQQAVAGPMS
jgi:hypothetical protein